VIVGEHKMADGKTDGVSASPAAEPPKLKRKEYEKELRKLQTELCLLQDWVKATGERIIVVFEGRCGNGS
jgi:polyphosphate kinase 2 (PPK2 family)